jgi:two-component sensor histidine kinase
VIQAVIRFSLPGEGMVRESAVKQRLMDRLQSMSATNRAITDSDGVRLNDLISSEIRGFESQFEISGNPRLVLGPQMTQNLSLILHELLTNALKYGALSVPHGRVTQRLDWTSWILTFVWQERGGPSVLPPDGSGFGSRILGAFAKSFCQNVNISYAPGGLRYTLQIHSDQNSCVEPTLVGAMATDAAGSVSENTGDAREPQPLLDRDAEFEEQRKVVLHDWQFYHAGKEG